MQETRRRKTFESLQNVSLVVSLYILPATSMISPHISPFSSPSPCFLVGIRQSQLHIPYHRRRRVVLSAADDHWTRSPISSHSAFRQPRRSKPSPSCPKPWPEQSFRSHSGQCPSFHRLPVAVDLDSSRPDMTPKKSLKNVPHHSRRTLCLCPSYRSHKPQNHHLLRCNPASLLLVVV